MKHNSNSYRAIIVALFIFSIGWYFYLRLDYLMATLSYLIGLVGGACFVILLMTYHKLRFFEKKFIDGHSRKEVSKKR